MILSEVENNYHIKKVITRNKNHTVILPKQEKKENSVQNNFVVQFKNVQ